MNFRGFPAITLEFTLILRGKSRVDELESYGFLSGVPRDNRLSLYTSKGFVSYSRLEESVAIHPVNQ